MFSAELRVVVVLAALMALSPTYAIQVELAAKNSGICGHDFETYVDLRCRCRCRYSAAAAAAAVADDGLLLPAGTSGSRRPP